MIPYRAKNPPESFPYATVSLIVMNTLTYLFTTEAFLFIRKDVVEGWAVSHETLNPLRLITAMFLHANLMHLLGNMLFLWIFGAAAEGRLKSFKFLAVYLISGLLGSLLHDGVLGALQPDRFGLGASGAIMGVAGAYLYMFPFARIRVWLGWGWMRYIGGEDEAVGDWQAQWVILYYVFFDLVEGFLWRSVGLSGGVAHFAHLGGVGAGLLCAFALRAQRDSEEVSEAQSIRADIGTDYAVLNLQDLEALLEREPNNPILVLTFCRKALTTSAGSETYELAREMFRRKADLLINQGDLDEVSHLAMMLSADSATAVPTPVLLRLGGKLESVGEYGLAETCYRRVFHHQSRGIDGEMALVRLGRLTEQSHHDKTTAVGYYTELLKRFPNSPNATYARTALTRLGAPVPTAAPLAAPTQKEPKSTMESSVAPEPKEPEIPTSAQSSGLRPLGS